VKRAKGTPLDTAQVLDALVAAVRVRFPTDSIVPGVVVANLGGGFTYASVRRYAPVDGVVACVKIFASSSEAIRELAKTFHRDYAPPPIQDAFEKLKAVLP
jgi:hypothetical protein